MHYLDTFNKQNRIFKITNGLITIIFFSLIILIINLLFFTPEIHGTDEMAKWSAGKIFIENFFIGKHWHSMRWGAWITTIIFQGFENGPVAYYLHNILVLHTSLIIFSYVIFKYSGIIPSIIFLFITHFNEFILWSGFQADITIETFLPLSLIILLIQKDVLKKDSYLYFFFFVFVSFYLYAVKETNLFFLPGIFYFIFKYYGIKKSINFIIIFVFFYFLETFFLKYFNDNNFSIYGRLFELMVAGKDLPTIDIVEINKLTFLDIIKNRWNYSGYQIIYLITFIVSFYIFLSRIKIKAVKKTEIFVALMTLSFFFFNTFSVMPSNPVKLIQGFNYRYNAVIFPICTAFISILIYEIFLLKKNYLIKILSLSIFFYIMTPTLKFISTAKLLHIRHTETNAELTNMFLYKSFFSRIKLYQELKKLIKVEDYCFISKQYSRLYAVPFILGYYPYHSHKRENYIDEKFIHSYKELDCIIIIDLDINF
jgi:hypothetical protein